MRPLVLLTAAVAIFAPRTADAQHQTATFDLPAVGGRLPYQITLREISLAPAAVPNIHSVAAADWNGQWVLLAGRTNGLHGLTGNNAFDPSFENRDVWVIDPLTKQSWHKSLETSPASGLTQDQIDSLSAVNTQFYQDGPKWYIVGGYGYQRSVADHRTYDTLTAVDLPGLVQWVKATAGTETTQAAQHIAQVHHSHFQVTGGGLERIGSEFQLVFGQNYAGRYRPNFNGVYTRQVRRFATDLSTGLAVPPSSLLATTPSDDYRRRDLNIATILQRTGPGEFQEKVVALAGVFTPDNGVWTLPVVVGAAGEVAMSPTLKQGLQIYHCAKAGLYHRATDEMHVVLFGGITVLEHDDTSGAWSEDAQAPFTNQCSTVVRRADGSFDQFYLPTRYPRILSGGKELRFGANAEFFVSPDVPRRHPRVIDLAAIRKTTVIGHVFGSLVADAGNAGNTGSSGRVFEVLLTPDAPIIDVDITRTDGTVTLSWQSEADASYLIEQSADLSAWQEAASPIAGTGAALQWQSSGGDAQHFYRVIAGRQSGE